MMNAHCQLQVSAMNGTMAGATTAPTLVPALKMPVANARSFLGNHSATVLMEAGKLAASPRPRAKRAIPKPRAERAAAWNMAATLQRVIARAKPRRVPIRSSRRPVTSSPRA